ncbi:coiled-coil domain protein [Trypanosoma grayi]|uniref:coiled-coil domain protein n=1 Tax=Trypanosoma grayi TaxID=71804 RepID=UPI0004F499F2|nr:coiled-coil domain protein [Trypanosoma grayi]KEG10320.1 coiled-coil domain protein [Trypanosoma grayi]
MPPRKTSAALRHRSHIIASSAEEQEAALTEWRAKARQDGEKLRRIASRIERQKKSTTTTERGGRWLAERTALDRETMSAGLELAKAWASCAALLPEVLLKEWAEQDQRCAELSRWLGARLKSVRRDLHVLRPPSGEASREAVTALRARLWELREENAEAKRVVDQEVEEGEEEPKQDAPTKTLEGLTQSVMETFAKICETKKESLHVGLIETYRGALQAEEEKALSQVVAGRDKMNAHMLTSSDIRTVSLILRTYDSAMGSGVGATPVVTEDVYDRVQQVLPHASAPSVRLAVNEVLRQKRDRLRVRSVALQYKKKSSELLDSFEKAISAEEDVMKMQICMAEETKQREERQQKTHEELERLRAVRDARDAARREEETAKRTEEEEKQQQILRLREAEFQERLKRLQEYQEQQRQLQEKERAVQQAMAEEEALKKAIEREHNAKRVEERKREYEEKCRVRRRHQEEAEEFRAAREKTLEAFFKGVERKLGVTCDAGRVLQGTASSQQNVPYVSFSEAAQCVVHGYTVNDIMRDPRFRLQLALMEAGLHQTPYGREVLSSGFHVPAAQRPSEDNPLRMEY